MQFSHLRLLLVDAGRIRIDGAPCASPFPHAVSPQGLVDADRVPSRGSEASVPVPAVMPAVPHEIPRRSCNRSKRRHLFSVI